MTKSMADILREAVGSSRAAFFSGRGAILVDLNYDKLKKVQREIKQHHGDAAAAVFVKMVASMPNMNATDFVNNCYLLENSDYGWRYEIPDKVGFDIQQDKDGNYAINEGLSTIGEGLFSNGKDETIAIRSRFLIENGIEIPATEDITGQWYRF